MNKGLSFKKIREKLILVKIGFSAYWNVLILKKMPVIVYASGRVGSVSVLKALRRAGVFSFKVEFFDHPKSNSTVFCKRYVLNNNRPVKFITLVRDPVEVLCSLYYSKLVRGHLTNANDALCNRDVSLIIEHFHSEILRSHYLESYLNWFENEFNPHLGLNVFSYYFDTNKGYSRFKSNRFEFLVIRSDLNNETKEREIKSFLDIDSFTLLVENSHKNNSELYNKILNGLRLKPDELGIIYNSRYARHFFSSDELYKLSSHWMRSFS